MKNLCKIDARKSDAQIMENERKWTPKGSQNPIKIKKNLEKTRSDNRCEKRSETRHGAEIAVGAKAT